MKEKFERLVVAALISSLAVAMLSTSFPVYSYKSSTAGWTRVGAVYVNPSSPENPSVMTPDQPPRSWWTIDFPLFSSQKYIDEMMLNRAFSAHPSKSLAIYFPQFLADVDRFGTTYLEELEEVIVFFWEKEFHILLFFGRTDCNAYSRYIDVVKNPSEREYLLNNINTTIRYNDLYNYIDEATFYWMAYVTIDYSPEEISEYNRQIKDLVNAVGVACLAHVDGLWFEENLNLNGYTPESVSPKFGCSDGLWAESWAQGSLLNDLNELIPEYFTASEVNMVCDVPNGYLGPSLHNPVGSVEKDMEYWFDCIEDVGITNWYVWDYYGAFESVPSAFSLIYPNATTLTQKGEFTRTVTETGLLYKDVALINVEPYRTVIGQGSITHINITLLNQGDFSETIGITTYINTTLLQGQSIELTTGNLTTLEYMWNASFPLGNYTINTEALIEEDVDMTDNTFTYSSVTIAIKGDLNTDEAVSIIDISIAAIAFGSDYGEDRFERNADMNEDGTINIIDISAIATEYGKTT